MNISPAVRQGSAFVGIAGALLLSGCAAEVSSAETPASSASSTPQTSATSTPSVSSTSAATSTTEYKDGTYAADGSYQTPETVEKISVSLTVADDTVTAVTVTGDPQAPETRNYQGQFIDGISAVVVGKKLDGLSVDKVAGSSLTGKGFNQALDTIRSEAKG
ncbi:FMN-binding protein [uncultured Microbacterium sp.]|uniref:FMN-binding protein n=1 Tax=uncultured Microbacterium sp. TaxID=191216 RepID=UPI0025D13F30|nr:FMN-binding protein [uncultured Microbacterium sp.]